ncbi:MAG: CoA transferase [Pseudomonadota bacterium]
MKSQPRKEPAPLPLKGLLVLDLTNVLAGPFCCHQLSHLGAEVIKVETVGRGDLARNLGADPALNAAGMGVSFLAQNAGKRSITLNLKDPRGAEILRDLVRRADVLVENFRPGVMARLGLDYPALREVNPRLIYCAISGFGQTGPWAHLPAYDQIIQGMAGVMAVTGDEDSAPLRVGYPVCDTIGGLTAAMAISAALNAPERGSFIDVSMLEATLATLGWVVSNYLISGVTPQAMGNDNPAAAPSGLFQAQDGALNIAANKDEQWRALVMHLGLPELLDDPRFVSRDTRKTHRVALRECLEKALKTRPAQDWVAELNALGIPAGPVLEVGDILADPHIQARALTTRYEDTAGVDRPVEVVRTGFCLDGVRPSVPGAPAALGAHSDEILAELGYDAEARAELRDSGVV